MNETIEVQRKWLETLANLAKQADKDMDKWYNSGKELMPTFINKLVGYASSAETLLKLNSKEDE